LHGIIKLQGEEYEENEKDSGKRILRQVQTLNCLFVKMRRRREQLCRPTGCYFSRGNDIWSFWLNYCWAPVMIVFFPNYFNEI
jgi:hypothetical protein